jgi:murein L,D-transpeptidase YcbB/YkuD
MKKFLFFIISSIFIFFWACKEKPPKIKPSNYLSRSFKDSLFYDYNALSQSLILKMRIERNLSHFSNIKLLDSIYKTRNYEPFLLQNFLENHSLDSLVKNLKKSVNHGLNPEFYKVAEIETVLARFNNHRIQRLVPAYISLADIELLSLNSIITYSKDLEFGRLNPNQIFQSQFNIKFKLPDSSILKGILKSNNLISYLNSIQPKSLVYNSLSRKLEELIIKNPNNWSGKSPYNDSITKLRVNLERLRWKSTDTSGNYLLVNIPEFRLYAIAQGKPLWSMKVCVGQRRKDDYASQMAIFHQTHNIDDRPENHQTPILFSNINSVQVNPKWSVPKSIIQNEIFFKMIQNPKYLEQNKMKLYKGNKLVKRPDTIHWNRIKRDQIPFNIKQDAGDFNSLGKLKFNFVNPYSVYLHDTPNKIVFNKKDRAISHGCVRVENPLKLANYLLQGNGKNAMDLVRIKIGLKPGDDSSEHLQKLYEKEQILLKNNQHTFEPSSVVLKIKMPLYIQYYTSGLDENGQIFYREDIYQMDNVILNKLQ